MEVVSTPPANGQQLVQRLRELAAKANAGDEQALFDLRTMLAEDRRIVEHLGDLSRRVEAALLEQLAAHDALTRESVREYVAQLRVTLAGPQPTEIERLLVDQVALCYLADRQAAHAEASTQVAPKSCRCAPSVLRAPRSGC